MGYIRHHALVVTSGFAEIEKAHKKAVVICGKRYVSNLSEEAVNGYRSFCVFPDGSKEGWEESTEAECAKGELISWLENQKYEDNSSPFAWVLVQFGDENLETKIVNDSDKELRRADKLAGRK